MSSRGLLRSGVTRSSLHFLQGAAGRACLPSRTNRIPSCVIGILPDGEDRKRSWPGSGPWSRSIHTDELATGALHGRKSSAGEKVVLYRAKWIRPIRMLVRLKLIQLGGIMALVIPLAEYSQQGNLSLGTTLAVGAVVGGAGAASVALWYYSRRFIGEMALVSPDMQQVQLSVLDFWGNREDLQFYIRDIVPPLRGMTKKDLEVVAQQILVPLDVIGQRQFFLSLRHGHLLNRDLLFTILNGSVEMESAEGNQSDMASVDSVHEQGN